jgi:hypothetical protein
LVTMVIGFPAGTRRGAVRDNSHLSGPPENSAECEQLGVECEQPLGGSCDEVGSEGPHWHCHQHVNRSSVVCFHPRASRERSRRRL